MRKINLGLSLILGLILLGSSALAQSGNEVGIIGPMSGRITNAAGYGVSGVTIKAIAVGSCFDWEGSSTITSPFGYYSLDVHYDCGIFIAPSKKNIIFTPSGQFIPIDGAYENVNFIAG